MTRAPSFWSLALADIPAPDYADVAVAVLPEGATDDPAVWARTMFSLRAMPAWVRVALGIRQVLAPLIGVPRAPRDVFRVNYDGGDEATISVDDVHLDFRVGVAVDTESRLVRVTTATRLKGRRGRLYFMPVRLAHSVVVHAMLARSQRLLAAAATA